MKTSSVSILGSALCILACGGVLGCSEEEEPQPTPSRDGVTEIALPGNDFYPEGIAASADNTLYVGSLMTGQIVRIRPGKSEAEEFVAPRSIVTGTVGLHVQEDKQYLWLCSNVFGTSNAPELIAVSLSTGQAVHRHVFPAQEGAGSGFCNEIAQDKAGNLYATDSFLGRIVRVPAGKLDTDNSAEVWARSDAFYGPQGQFGLNGLTYDGASTLYAVKTADGKLFRIPIGTGGAAGTVQEVTLDRPLVGPDGLKYSASAGLVVSEQYATAVSRIALSADGGGTVTKLLEGLKDPTSVELAEGSAWVSESQLTHLTSANPPPLTLPFYVRRVSLPKQ
jgi:sugar lactone lactonase YvrE